MKGYVIDIEKATTTNENFRRVLYTAEHSQLVTMALRPGEDIGMEVHHDVDQFIRVEAGECKAILDGEEHDMKAGDAVVIPAGTNHNIINASADKKVSLYTIYSPPHHPDGTTQATKAEAEAAEAQERAKSKSHPSPPSA